MENIPLPERESFRWEGFILKYPREITRFKYMYLVVRVLYRYYFGVWIFIATTFRSSSDRLISIYCTIP